MVQVSLSTSTNYDGELNALLEDQGTALTVSFDLDEPAPSGGLKVYVDSDVEQIVNRLDLPGFGGNPIVKNINPSLLGTNFDNSGFYLTIDPGATSASFTINVFDNEEPDTFQPETFDGLVEAVFQLKTQEQVDSQDLGDVGNLGAITLLIVMPQRVGCCLPMKKASLPSSHRNRIRHRNQLRERVYR